jgi:uncharacterized protein (UPF0332 family)
MTLEQLLGQGRLSRKETSRREVRSLLEVVERLLRDAEVEEVSADGRFVSAYGAVLQTATVLIRCSGYRTKGIGHHYTTFQAPSAVLPSESRLISYFEACRSKRNLADYTQAGAVSEKEVRELIAEARAFLSQVRRIISTEFPSYAP